jgi:SAM-dependent methyltransferase
VIVSDSTLDHFHTEAELVGALRELHRVLRPGGVLLLTMDNLANPVIALRNALPFRLLNRLGIVPYYVGATAGPRRLRRLLEQTGWEIRDTGAIVHCLRVVWVMISRVVERRASRESQERFLRFMMRFEWWERWPTRFLTGNFIAMRATTGECG